MNAFFWFFKIEMKLFWRQKGPFLGSLLFSLILVLLLCFSLEFQTWRTSFIPPALWLGLLFNLSMLMEREWARDRSQGMSDRIRLLPTPIICWYWGKVLSALLRLIVFSFWLTFCVTFFMGGEKGFGLYFSSLLLTGTGMIGLGTLLGAFSVYSKMPDTLFPILFYPLLIPLIIVGSRVLTFDLNQTGWIKILLGIDILYLASGTFLFSILNRES